jgi:hypothetical protein
MSTELLSHTLRRLLPGFETAAHLMYMAGQHEEAASFEQDADTMRGAIEQAEAFEKAEAERGAINECAHARYLDSLEKDTPISQGVIVHAQQVADGYGRQARRLAGVDNKWARMHQKRAAIAYANARKLAGTFE